MFLRLFRMVVRLLRSVRGGPWVDLIRPIDFAFVCVSACEKFLTKTFAQIEKLCVLIFNVPC